MFHQPASQFQPSDVEPSEPDAALIALGARLETALVAVRAADAECSSLSSDEADARVEAVTDISFGLVREIERLPARTLAGLRVKALALHHCHGEEPIDDRFFCLTGDEPPTDLRLAAGILRDLLNL